MFRKIHPRPLRLLKGNTRLKSDASWCFVLVAPDQMWCFTSADFLPLAAGLASLCWRAWPRCLKWPPRQTCFGCRQGARKVGSPVASHRREVKGLLHVGDLSRSAKGTCVGVQGERRLSSPSWPFDPLHSCHALAEIDLRVCGTWCGRKGVLDVLWG